ncbi:MAG: YfiR family protein [Propionivibrio sp.]
MPEHKPSRRLQRIFDRALRCALLVWVGLSPLHAVNLPAQETAAPPMADSTLQALYLFNFAKFIEWPEKVFANQQSPITLCLYGERPSEIRTSIGAIEGKIAQGRELRVVRSATLANLDACQIVFVPGSERRWLSEVLRVAHAANALTVSDMDNFIESGGGVGLLIVDRQIRFEFNLDATQAAHLKVSAQLLKLARTVKGQGTRP